MRLLAEYLSELIPSGASLLDVERISLSPTRSEEGSLADRRAQVDPLGERI
jgi:hypothetical protein